MYCGVAYESVHSLARGHVIKVCQYIVIKVCQYTLMILQKYNKWPPWEYIIIA